MSTDAPDTTPDAAPPAKPPTWRLDTDNGSLTPRSALDVLVDLNDKVTTGQVVGVPARPARVHPARQDHRQRPARR